MFEASISFKVVHVHRSIEENDEERIATQSQSPEILSQNNQDKNPASIVISFRFSKLLYNVISAVSSIPIDLHIDVYRK